MDGKAKSEACQVNLDQETLERDRQNQLQQIFSEIEASKHISSGDNYYDNKDYERAIEEYDAAFELNPHNLAVLRKRVEIRKILSPISSQSELIEEEKRMRYP